MALRCIEHDSLEVFNEGLLRELGLHVAVQEFSVAWLTANQKASTREDAEVREALMAAGAPTVVQEHGKARSTPATRIRWLAEALAAKARRAEAAEAQRQGAHAARLGAEFRLAELKKAVGQVLGRCACPKEAQCTICVFLGVALVLSEPEPMPPPEVPCQCPPKPCLLTSSEEARARPGRRSTEATRTPSRRARRAS